MEVENIKKIKLTERLEKKAKKLSLAGDETRIRILCLMYETKQACVTDIAESLGMSVAAVSHHLQLMKEEGYFTTLRCGNNIKYALVDNDFTRKLKPIICDC